MRRTLTCLAVLALAAACADASSQSSGQPPSSSGSLASAQGQLPPPGSAPSVMPAPAPQPPAEGPKPIAQTFDPAKQRFVWVLPPGIHGKGPWTFAVVVKQAGEVKHESTIPLKAEMVAPGSRPEYPAGYEIVRLTDDGAYQQHAADLDKVIAGIVAQYGLGKGELEMRNDLKVAIDDTHRKAYCVDNQMPDVHLYIDDVAKPDLIPLNVAAMAPILQAAVKQACTS